jgi:uncharacterized protein (TIGR02301 family)
MMTKTLRPRFWLMAALTAALTLSAPVSAQPSSRNVQHAETPDGRRAMYGEELRGLAQSLGGAHYLRVLCMGEGDQSYRDLMRDLLNREAGRGRQPLVDAFNAGYRENETRFPVCSPAAQAQETALRARGMRFADALAARHKD